MEDKIKELIESAMESGADIKVVKINGNKSKSIKKLLDEIEENMDPKTLIQYEFKISPIENSICGSLRFAMLKYVEDISALTKEDIIEIFKPVEDVLKECGKEFIEKLNANKRVPSSEEVRKIMDELLGDNKDVN